METARDIAALTHLLAWYREMGVDCAVADAGVDWCARGDAGPGAGFAWPPGAPSVSTSEPPQRRVPSPRGSEGAAPIPPVPASRVADTRETPRPPLPARPPAAETRPRPPAGVAASALAAPDAAVRSARDLAQGARSLADLVAALQRFDGCGLKATAKSLCVYRGAETARVMVIGEAPGAEEDREGRPFVGPAGQLLDRMLAAVALTEADVHITNVVYWRPPGNRTPTPQETLVCRPFLERQAELVSPEIVVLMGGAAAKQVLDVTEGIMRVRGSWREVTLGAHRAAAIATLHPAYLLRTPAAKRLAWRDLLAIRARLDGAG